MASYQTIRTEYKEYTKILQTLQSRSQIGEDVVRATGLYNDGQHCALNSAIGLLIAIGKEDKLESVIQHLPISHETDVNEMLNMLVIAKRYLNTNIGRMSKEDKHIYMLGTYAMHRNGLYAIQRDLTWHKCKIIDIYNNSLTSNIKDPVTTFLSDNLLHGKTWSSYGRMSSIISDSGVFSYLKFIFNKQFMINNLSLDIQFIDFSFVSIDIKHYGKQEVLEQIETKRYRFYSNPELTYIANFDFMIKPKQYYPYILEQWKSRLLACTAKTVIVKTMAPIALVNSPKSLDVIIGVKNEFKTYSLKAFSSINDFDEIGYGHFEACFIEEDSSLVYMFNRYKFTLTKGLEDELAKYLLYSANVLVYKRIDIN